jgi:hypothetical protein
MIKLDFSDQKVSEPRINLVEKTIGVKFPEIFINLVKNNDGAHPVPDIFSYYDIFFKRENENCVGAFLCIEISSSGDILTTYQDPPEFFPEGIVSFAEDGGGNYICFDYREGKDNLDPPIVYWNHEANEGEDVSFVAKDFETFLGMLYLDEE